MRSPPFKTIELMWGYHPPDELVEFLFIMAYVRFAFTIKCLFSHIKTLVLSMMLFSSLFVRRCASSPLSCPQFKSNERVSW